MAKPKGKKKKSAKKKTNWSNTGILSWGRVNNTWGRDIKVQLI